MGVPLYFTVYFSITAAMHWVEHYSFLHPRRYIENFNRKGMNAVN